MRQSLYLTAGFWVAAVRRWIVCLIVRGLVPGGEFGGEGEVCACVWEGGGVLDLQSVFFKVMHYGLWK